MQLIKLDATPSTNSYLKELMRGVNLDDFTVVVCEHQTKGRGQQGNIWISERGKNLIFSVLKHIERVKTKNAFALNAMVSLAVYDTLRTFKIPQVSVKWPNDIMSGNKKICGILIENTLKGNDLKKSIIGIGLNVNQEVFSELPHASSLKCETGLEFDLELILKAILVQLKKNFERFEGANQKEILNIYNTVLFKKGVPAKFLTADGKKFIGVIVGVSEFGKLEIQLKDGTLCRFGFKELVFVY